MTNLECIKHFYNCFTKADIEGMLSCYHEHIEFEDPAFGKLYGLDVSKMWRMLIIRSKGQLQISYQNAIANDKTGSVQWKAEYEFSQTGRKIVNNITAHFEFQNGKIIKHSDHFNLWKWTQQAFGWKGYLFGWTSFMKNKIRKQTNTLLNKFEVR
ncbi:MAG: nuclear transport factor 2 family protein [Saprospiraceae bacterium]|nr:nuclear transport factor 2 family protein [Saprospiraceae bacterium]MBK9722364.1 nuclear transport factor 2 family protein [Saprospiraceae bacterium]